MWLMIEKIRMQIKRWYFLRKWKRCKVREAPCESPCDELGWCPYTDSVRCDNCIEKTEVWE